MAKVVANVDAHTNAVSFNDIKTWFEQHMHPAVIDFTDPKPYEVYEKGKWAGIFQCVDQDTAVLMGDDSYKLIKDVHVGDEVTVFDEVKQQFTTSVVDVVYDQGPKECIELVFDDGKKLVCTADHPILTKNRGWVEAQHLTEDDELIGSSSGYEARGLT
jgi:hypothetical protein